MAFGKRPQETPVEAVRRGRKTQGLSQRKLSEDLCKPSCLTTVPLSNRGAGLGVPPQDLSSPAQPRKPPGCRSKPVAGMPTDIWGPTETGWVRFSAGRNAAGLACKPGGREEAAS